MWSRHDAGSRPEQITDRADFAELICSDPDLLRREFDELIADSWDVPARPGRPPLRPPARRPQRRVPPGRRDGSWTAPGQRIPQRDPHEDQRAPPPG